MVADRRRLLLGFVAMSLALSLRAEAAEANTTTVIKILLRTLTFDRTFGEGIEGDIGVAVLYDGTSPSSRREMQQITGELEKASRVRIAGKLMNVRNLDCSNEQELAELSRGKIHVAFIAADLPTALFDRVVGISRRHQIPTLSSSREQVERGAAIGAVVDNDRPRLLINLPASKASGMLLSSHMLRMAEVIR